MLEVSKVLCLEALSMAEFDFNLAALLRVIACEVIFVEVEVEGVGLNFLFLGCMNSRLERLGRSSSLSLPP